jgi:hypothetical protein
MLGSPASLNKVALLALFCFEAARAQTSVIFNNIGVGDCSFNPTTNYCNNYLVSGPASSPFGAVSEAARFIPTTTGSATDARVVVAGLPSPLVNVALFSDDGGLPGAPISQTVAITAAPFPLAKIITASFSQPVLLEVGLPYWLVLMPGNGSTDVIWAFGGVSSVPVAQSESATGSTGWIGIQSQALQFAVDGNNCPVFVNLDFSGQSIQYMVASFAAPPSSKPNSSTALLDYANTCGFESFNWQQQITHDPGGGGPVPENPLPLIETGNVAYEGSIVSPSNGVCLTPPTQQSPSNWNGCSLVAPPSFYDPPQGGYFKLGFGTFNPWPFFYPAYPLNASANGQECTIASANCPPFPFVVSLDGTTLSFVDDPAQHNLSGELPTTNPSGNFLAFQTSLVGVDQQNSPHTLYWWRWNTTYNGSAGGTDQTASFYPIDPGSGTGGIAITEINGYPFSKCDIDLDGPVNVLDVQRFVNEALGGIAPTADLNGDGTCDVVDVQIVINAALGLGCITK